MKMELLLLRPFRDRDMAYLQTALEPYYKITIPAAFSEHSLMQAIIAADAVLGAQLPGNILGNALRLKLVQTPGVGTEHLDLAALNERGILVSNTHTNSAYVAEYALGMLLSLIKKLPENNQKLKSGLPPSHDPAFLSGSLYESSIGLWGLGHVGQKLLQLLKPFRTSVYAYVRHPDKHLALLENHPELTLAPKDKILADSDINIITLPATPLTKNIFDDEAFSKLREGSILINVGRAEIINRQALLQALKIGKLGGVGLDVWWSNNIVKDCADFTSFDMMLCGAHRAGTHAAHSPHLTGVVENLIQFARTGSPINIVDPFEHY